MTQAELDAKNAARFAVKYVEETKYERGGWALIDTTTGTVVGRDGGEPEDQLLVRDWSWVQDLANALAAESTALRAALKAIAAEILSPDYPSTPPTYERPASTYEASYGGGDCSAHGRWYGRCESCVIDFRRATDLHDQAWANAKRERLVALARAVTL